jgi:phasin family protein
MATKAPRKQAPKAVAATPDVAAAPTPVPPVADEATDAVADAAPVETAIVEDVVEAVEDISEAAAPASLQQKGKSMIESIKNQGEKFTAELKTRAEDSVAKGKQLFADWTEFNKGNVEAMVESGKIAAKGFEQLGREQVDYARKSFEQTTAAFKGMAAVKSPTELAKLHSEYVRSSFDALVAQTSHQTEAMLKLAGEIAQPLSNRFAVAAEKVKLAA